MKQPVLFLYFLCLVLTGGPATGETLALNAYLMTFKGYSEDTNRGIEEYIVEFPGYTGHELISKEPSGNEYRYESRDVPYGIVTNLRRMFAYLDVEGRIDTDESRITVTHPLYEEPPEPQPEPEAALQAALQPPPSPTPKPKPKPLMLRLSTARGDKPAFSIGEKFDLTVELSRDAWLYCFYRQVDGRVVKFFPNPHHEDAWVKGGRQHRVPGAIYPFELVFAEPPGDELMTCFATARDVRADLPAALRTPDLAALPPGMDSRLQELFDGLADTDVARASLPIAVRR